jgi:hypothetical protein
MYAFVFVHLSVLRPLSFFYDYEAYLITLPCSSPSEFWQEAYETSSPVWPANFGSLCGPCGMIGKCNGSSSRKFSLWLCD